MTDQLRRSVTSLVGDTGVVHSVEPVDFLYPPTRMLGLRRGANVRCHSVSLGVVAGEDTLNVPLRRGRPVVGRSYLTRGSNGVGSNAEFAAHMAVSAVAETLNDFVQRLE